MEMGEMTENCNHNWEPVSTDRNKDEWIDGLGDHPEVCRRCGTIRGTPTSDIMHYKLGEWHSK